MASTRKSQPGNDLVARVAAVLRRHVRRGDRVVAGLSGGIDSLVMIDVLRRLMRRHGFRLAALHINHQIHPRAVNWAAHCRKWCRGFGVPVTVVKVTVPPTASLEAAAREQRYRAFALAPADFVALAHNLDDQAETVVMQLLRGSGARGLSAMPECRNAAHRSYAEDDGTAGPAPAILRPLLEIPRAQIEDYARRRKLVWVEDSSNVDVRFDRNFLRHQVMPLVGQRYPAYRATLLRASRNAAEAAHLLDELAELDLAGGGADERGLGVSMLNALSAPRAKNVLRYFLSRRGVTMPNAARLDECVRQLRHSRAASFALDLDGRVLRRHGDTLHVVGSCPPVAGDFSREWHGEPCLRLPELGGTLEFEHCRGRGISLAKLGGPLTVRVRRGGESLRPEPRRPLRSLKNLLQEARVPPWSRGRLPLLYAGQILVCVPGIGVDAAFQAARTEAGVVPRWKED